MPDDDTATASISFGRADTWRRQSVPSSDRHLAKAVGTNAIFSLMASFVQVGTRLVTVPIVIHYLGLNAYGIWATIMATAAYMRLGSAGVKSAFQKYAAEAIATGNFVNANQLLSTGSILMLALSLVCLAPLAIFSKDLATFSGVPAEFTIAASRSITVLALIIITSNFGSVFEAILMGAHRLDITRMIIMATTAAEAIFIVAALRLGYGLFSSAVITGIGELIYICCCFAAARRIVPEIRIRARYFTTSVWRELRRYVASYQLVNFLEVLYGMLLPVTILRNFGAGTMGVYAVVSRLVSVSQMGPDALVLPILSGGTAMFSSGSTERIRRFIKKSFKVTLALASGPLAFVAAFGTLLVQLWTNKTDPEFSPTIWWTCAAVLFTCVSRLQLVLYRASGKALHDNVRQVFRLVVLVALAALCPLTGFHGMLAGLAAAEALGVVYMFFAMASALDCFRPRDLLPDSTKVTAAIVLIIAAGYGALMVPIPWKATQQEILLIKLVGATLACLAASWPAVAITKPVSTEEWRTILSVLFPWKRPSALATEQAPI